MNLTPQDAAMLRVLAGARFGENAKLTLPSGAVLDADEANALTAAYLPDSGLPDRTVPPDIADQPWHGSIKDVAGWWAANDRLEAQLKATQAEAERMWWLAVYFGVTALVAVTLLVTTLLTGLA